MCKLIFHKHNCVGGMNYRLEGKWISIWKLIIFTIIFNKDKWNDKKLNRIQKYYSERQIKAFNETLNNTKLNDWSRRVECEESGWRLVEESSKWYSSGRNDSPEKNDLKLKLPKIMSSAAGSLSVNDSITILI